MGMSVDGLEGPKGEPWALPHSGVGEMRRDRRPEAKHLSQMLLARSHTGDQRPARGVEQPPEVVASGVSSRSREGTWVLRPAQEGRRAEKWITPGAGERWGRAAGCRGRGVGF